MPEQFTDIKIVSLDDAASGPSGQGSLLRLVLRLSRTPPGEWSDYFNHVWQQQFYMMKRHATVSGDRLEIICMPNRLKTDHLPELKKVISQTNDAYNQHHIAQNRARQAEKQRVEQQRQEVANLEERLHFD